jgi:hypothetical protein
LPLRFAIDMTTQSPHPDIPETRATAQYIATMARDLKGLAVGAGLPFTAYLLGMVEEDASTVYRQAEKSKTWSVVRSEIPAPGDGDLPAPGVRIPP